MSSGSQHLLHPQHHCKEKAKEAVEELAEVPLRCWWKARVGF